MIYPLGVKITNTSSRAIETQRGPSKVPIEEIQEVLKHYVGIQPSLVSKVPGALVNPTYVIETEAFSKIYLQKSWGVRHLAQTVFSVETARLAHQGGAHVIEYVETANGQLVVLKEFEVWKLSRDAGCAYVDSDDNLRACIIAMHSFHTATASLLTKTYPKAFPYELSPTNVSEISNHISALAATLHETTSSFMGGSLQQFDIDWISRQLRSATALLSQDLSIIHGDPKAANFVCRGSRANLIDFESCCVGPIWVDLADFIRSFAQREKKRLSTESETQVFLAVASSLWDAYRDFCKIDFEQLILAVRVITLRLVAHLLLDLFRGAYFRELTTDKTGREKLVQLAIQQYNWARAICS